ncbi:MAG: TIGR04282 family arsenosugar biosynthesis glycosyltransferase [Desulfotomaculaceae bacterium]|nr:TIGR04282 family arsenosugar biosynthesis glycosyltransferase [Desulfotomaculaceae bacterium]
MLKPALAIMSRMPSTEGKSRLGAVLSPAQREALQWAFLEDTLDKIRPLTEFKRYLAVTPPSAGNKLAQAVGLGGQVLPQPDGNLGQRMRGIAEQLFLMGHAPVILIGTDVPALPPAYLLKALALLEQSDMVLGPACDGGYYLIGMRHMKGRVFENINWGTDTVLEKTLTICDKNKWTYRLLERLMDIDRPGDLLALLVQYENNQIAFTPTPARTIALLKAIYR